MNLTSELLDQALPQAAAATAMVRIARGGQQRWIWPVHLSGWIALGWQVSHPSTSAPAAAVAGVGELEEQTPTAGLSEAVSPANTSSATNGRRRGRKPKAQETAAAEPPAELVGDVTTAEPEAAQPTVDPAAEAAPEPATTELPSPEVIAVEAAEDAAAPAFVLPDDLLGETF